MNHYSPLYAKEIPRGSLGFAVAAPPPDVPQTPIGWPIVPDAFRDALLAVDARYRLPIYVLENGFGAHNAADGSGRILDLVGPAEPFILIIDPNMGDRLDRRVPRENEPAPAVRQLILVNARQIRRSKLTSWMLHQAMPSFTAAT